MLERFLKSIDPSNIRELSFEFIWDKYVDDDIASVIDTSAWGPIDDALYGLAERIRRIHPGRTLNLVLSVVVVSRSTDLGKARLGSLFSKFRGAGRIALQPFLDHLPPVSFIISPHRTGPHDVFYPRAYTPQICLSWQ